MAAEGLGLAAAVEALREDLDTAWQAGRGSSLRFRASEITLRLETVARLDKDGSGKVRWYVVEAGAGVKSATERTQTLTLTLVPQLYDGERAGPLDVEADQAEPGH